jgi:hypothetical protein
VRHVMILLTSITMVGTSVASFSGNTRADGGQVAAGILGGLAAGTILGAATAPRPYYAPAPVYVIAIGLEVSRSGTAGDKPGSVHAYRFATEAQRQSTPR